MARYTVQTATGLKRKTIYGKDAEDVARSSRTRSRTEQGLVFDAGTDGREISGRWLLRFVRGIVRISTFERHEQIIRGHLTPAIGRVKLKALTPAHVRSLHREKLDAGLSPATVRKIHSTLHKALSQAVVDGLSPQRCRREAPRPAADEMRPLSEAEARTFLDTARGTGDRFELSTCWQSPRGYGVGSCWASLGRCGPESSTLRVGALSCERVAVTSWARPRPSGRRRVNLTPRTWRLSRRTAGATGAQGETRQPLRRYGLIFASRTGRPSPEIS